MTSREYERSHPWITFLLDTEKELDHECWLLLGEATSKMDHIAGVPLRPDIAAELNKIYLSKGAHATTQIEGNTLSEEDVRRRVDKQLELPVSQEYLGQEIDNVVTAYNMIVEDVAHGRALLLTIDRIQEFNKIVLDGLPGQDENHPGEIRHTSVVVGDVYRGAPAEDCEFLLETLCSWLDGLRSTGGALRKPVAVLAAIMAHLYLAWIHPFEDGNGRTARLIEFQMLIQAGAPTVAAHVLADHYNKTRTEYYRQLRLTSQSEPYSLKGMIKYALQGLVDGLREQINQIQGHQLKLTWENYIHAAFHDKATPACARQRKLILSLNPAQWTQRSAIRELTPSLAADYAVKEDKTITRDINALESMGLLVKRRRGNVVEVHPEISVLRAFMPLVANEN